MDRSLANHRHDQPKAEVHRGVNADDRGLLQCAAQRAGFKGKLYNTTMGLLMKKPGVLNSHLDG